MKNASGRNLIQFDIDISKEDLQTEFKSQTMSREIQEKY